MVPVSTNPGNQFADTASGIPDPATAGPDWWLIGTEGGFMPAPVVVPQKPIGFNMNTGQFSFGIVNQHSLFLGSAERADVVVDFTGKEGQTFIVYNDSPAPVPAGRRCTTTSPETAIRWMEAGRPTPSPATAPIPDDHANPCVPGRTPIPTPR